MCGFAGVVCFAPEPAEHLESAVRRMSRRLVHRGPDDEGVWSDGEAGACLGHRRLSILDLSPAGHQPMCSEDGRWVIAYNGEVYDFAELREQLAARGHRFRGGSDTEVLLAAVAEWGPAEALRRSNGMFAVALWDRVERRLWLGRDRVGKKPLYYGWVGRRFAFASELSALRTLEGFDDTLDLDAVAHYLRFNAVGGARSIHAAVRKVLPGTLLSLDAAGAAGRAPRMLRYWSAADVVRERAPSRLAASRASLVDELDALLRDAVALRMESDVPLGAFLSGGIDSSLVVALMQAQTSQPVRTFSIGFHVPGWDEAPHAAAVARYLGTEHTELYLTEHDARAVIPELPRIYDEPFADVSQIPTYLVAKMAREHVTVCLSGDGGDELFAGYARYPFVESLWRRFAPMPPVLRSLSARAARLARGQRHVDRAIRWVEETDVGAHVNLDRARLLESLLLLRDGTDFYRYLLSMWREDRPLVRGAQPGLLPSVLDAPGPPPTFSSEAELASYVDLLEYLPDDILVKVDRATMAVSLEARAPLLDYRVVELAWSLPFEQKLRSGVGKLPLRDLVHRYLPRALMERPKMGFGVPIGEWLRGPLRQWADDLLSPARLRAEGILDHTLVSRRWQEHREGRRNWAPEVWAVLMFEAWRDHLCAERAA